jgi:hypothetical protein
MMKLLVVFLGLIALINANSCDNACSGHGICGTNSVCQCYEGWGMGLSLDSGDCSQRICPFEYAWADTPDRVGNHHKYIECSAKGICNRDRGECECFPGYEGKACARTTCHNDCSGHGICNEYGVCDCYSGWGIGLSIDGGDCSQRICPFEFAWVDTPDKIGNHHKYVECSAKGICNRDSGECECFPGYEGKGCARTTCPNDCSGNGTCSFIDLNTGNSVSSCNILSTTCTFNCICINGNCNNS